MKLKETNKERKAEEWKTSSNNKILTLDSKFINNQETNQHHVDDPQQAELERWISPRRRKYFAEEMEIN